MTEARNRRVFSVLVSGSARASLTGAGRTLHCFPRVKYPTGPRCLLLSLTLFSNWFGNNKNGVRQLALRKFAQWQRDHNYISNFSTDYYTTSDLWKKLLHSKLYSAAFAIICTCVCFHVKQSKGLSLIFPFVLSFAVKRKVTIHSIAHFSTRLKRYKWPSFLARNQQQLTCLAWQISASCYTKGKVKTVSIQI